ncbi:sialidase domain-containing protein [Gemelliphila palaticanis]|uniref:exo-alpha-sialidase n=1 Tax=Gemelliphila palaticanis TaxID=81950 RepID=A0ABX2T1K1_9BACL|nr:sialidase domain-containing protein [Gemella palaticanis]MBF0715379.1 exo-alpha-sialidase [Gemella palaticanis]NYS47309.1 exo-alpha-sialidase [Gemella palaticanis]
MKLKNKLIISTILTSTIFSNADITFANNTIFSDNNITNKKQVDLTNEIKNLENASFVIEFTSDNISDVQSLLSISDSSTNNKYFNIYITKQGGLGIETRNNNNTLYFKPAALRGKYLNEKAKNTVVVTIDKNNKTYKIYSNGFLQLEQKVENFITLKDITNKNNFYLGSVFRQNNHSMPFSGTIHKAEILNRVLSETEAINITKKTSYGKTIFSSNDNLKSNYYRIPTLITLKNGDLLSSIDARKGGTHDARSNIDIAVARSKDNGDTWTDKKYAMRFLDYKDTVLNWPRDNSGKNIQISGSASFIDSVLLQDETTNRVFLFADAMPHGIGFNNAVRNSGFKIIDGKKYLKLKKNGESEFNYSIRNDRFIYNDNTNTRTEYRVDKNYNVLKNNKYVYNNVYDVRITGSTIQEFKTNEKAYMNIFYKDSDFTVERTNFLVYAYSDDNGKNWSNFNILEPFGDINESVPLYGPGRGIQIKNGIHKGRLLLSMYSSRTGEFGFMYSDDHGASWKYKKVDLGRAGATAEAQTIEFSNGDLRTFYRTSIGKIGYVTSKDGGLTWDSPKYLDNINVTSYGTQLSAITYSKMINGKDAIIMSYPESRNGRKQGSIKIGLSDPNDPNHNISWDYKYNIDDENYGFSYSALTELQTGEIGIYYEKWDSWSRNELHLNNVMLFEKYDINTLMNK